MMGFGTDVVDISSDDEDSWTTPHAAERNSTVASQLGGPGGSGTPAVANKSGDGTFEWVQKLLGEDDNNTVRADDAEELLAFLNETSNILGVDDAEEKPEEKSSDVNDNDDDDDDCLILEGDPEKVVAIAKEDGPRRDSTQAEEDELQIVGEKGELACRDFPHPRHLCASLSFSTSSHASHCNMCHCYVCDSPAPCAFWGNGTGINDHCHATDKDHKWKMLRQISKLKRQETPKLSGVQNLHQSSSTSAANLMIPSKARFAVSSSVNPVQQMHPSLMVPQNMGQGTFRPNAPSPGQITTILSNRSKRARVAPPVSTPSNVNYLQHSVPSYSSVRSAFPRGFSTAPVPPGDSYCLPYQPHGALPPLNAPNGSQVYQSQALPYPSVPNTVVGTGVPLSRCTSLYTRRKQQPLGPTANAASTLKDALTDLANILGVPDYNTEPSAGQQSASSPSQTLYPAPNQELGAKASQGGEITPNYAAGQTSLQIRLSGTHNSSNHTSGSTLVSPYAIQAGQPLGPFNPQSSLVPSGNHSEYCPAKTAKE